MLRLGGRSRSAGAESDYGAFAEALRGREVAFICHHNADPDSLLSAYALWRTREAFGLKRAAIYAPADISSIARGILQRLDPDAEVIEGVEGLEDWDAVCLVDTSTLKQLSPEAAEIVSRRYEGRLLIIDHHEPHPETLRLAKVKLIEPDARATAVIVFRLLRFVGAEIDERLASALVAAIVYDTRRFAHASEKVFDAMVALYPRARYSEVLGWLQHEMDLSERIARVKAAMRARFYRAQLPGGPEVIVALSHVSAFEASAARALVDLGADVAIVAGRRHEELRVCARASNRFRRLTGVHLGRDLMMKLGAALGGAGGGHEAAASANCRGTIEQALDLALSLLEQRLNARMRRIE